MSRFQILPSAAHDLLEILDYLTVHASLDIVADTEFQLVEGFRALARNPGLGHRRSDITPKVCFFFTVAPYVIIYRKAAESVDILAVLHGSRNIKKILKRRSI